MFISEIRRRAGLNVKKSSKKKRWAETTKQEQKGLRGDIKQAENGLLAAWWH